MIFFSARKPLTMTFFGESYALEPLTHPEINPDHILAAPNGLGHSIVNRHRQHLQIIDFEADRIPGFPRRLMQNPADLPVGTRIIMLRDAGIGDALTMTPIIAHLNKLDNRVLPVLATLKDRHELFAGTGCPLLPLPIRLSQLLGQADFFIDFHDPKDICEKVEMIDFNFDSLNIDPRTIPSEQKIPSLAPEIASSDNIRTRIDSLTREFLIRILYAPGASDQLRVLPDVILKKLALTYPDIAFISTDSGSEPIAKNVFSLETSESLRAFITAIDHCDGVVSSDSSAYHLATALGRPALAIFGPVPSSIRSGYYPKVVALDAAYQGQTCHSPCMIHGHLFRNAGIPIGREGIRQLKAGTPITTFSGSTFTYDPEKGCPEMNCCDTPNSPCLMNISDAALLPSFEKLLELLEKT